MTPSVSPLASRFSGPAASASTGGWCPSSTPSSLWRAGSHRRIIRSAPALATMRPSALNTTVDTPPAWPDRTPRFSPVVRSQSWMVLSLLPLATVRPSGAKATQVTALLCPCITTCTSPVCASRMCSVWSRVATANIRGTEANAGLWHLSTRRGTEPRHSPITSFYYGSEITGTFDTGAANAGSITTPVIALGVGSPTLSFNYVLQTEGNGSFDVASVHVSTNNFATFTTVLASTSSSSLPLSSTWRTATASLAAFAGQKIQLRFVFDTVDSTVNAFDGWYVDDVQVELTPDEDW